MKATTTVEQVKHFLAAHGRDIEQAQLAYHFEGAPLDELLRVLETYQNADGGFAGLEPDIAAPESNPFATELALAICAQAHAPQDTPLLQRAVAHLERTQDEDGGWRFTPAIYEHELAPWFQGWEWPNLNPSCTLSGLLRELGLGSAALQAKVEQLFARLANVKDLLSDEFYAVRPYVYYFLPEWAHPQRDLYLSGVVWWLIRQQANDSLDGNHFFQYVRSPETQVARMLPAALIEERLDRLAAEQMEDGGWPSPYADHWRGPITMQNLLFLRAFGRL